MTYRSPACALCNGAKASQLVFAPCGTDASSYVLSCPPETVDSDAARECLFLNQDYVCGYPGRTYRNAACAACNGLRDDQLTLGMCTNAYNPFPCAAVACPAHAHCSRTIADCDFEAEGLCGWTNVVGSESYAYDAFDWTRLAGMTPTVGTGPDVDHTLGTASGHYLYLETSNGSYGHEAHLTSPVFDPSQFGSTCTFSFWFVSVPHSTLRAQSTPSWITSCHYQGLYTPHPVATDRLIDLRRDYDCDIDRDFDYDLSDWGGGALILMSLMKRCRRQLE